MLHYNHEHNIIMNKSIRLLKGQTVVIITMTIRNNYNLTSKSV